MASSIMAIKQKNRIAQSRLYLNGYKKRSRKLMISIEIGKRPTKAEPRIMT